MGAAACGPRCGECRRGIGVHEPRDPLCAWHEPSAHPDAEVIYASGWPRRYKGIDVHHETPDDGCYICQPDNPRADPEGCSDCDRKAHTPPRPSCASCGHIHAASGCTGPPTPSDLWAGVPVSSCDCDETPAPRAALTTDPSEGESRG